LGRTNNRLFLLLLANGFGFGVSFYAELFRGCRWYPVLDGFIEAAMNAGNPVIVIATESHRASLFQRLREMEWK
jgi:hypothetical protein